MAVADFGDGVGQGRLECGLPVRKEKAELEAPTLIVSDILTGLLCF